MLITIKKETDRQEVDKLVFNLKPRKAFNSDRFLGKLKWNEDACQYQKKLRDEWN